MIIEKRRKGRREGGKKKGREGEKEGRRRSDQSLQKHFPKLDTLWLDILLRRQRQKASIIFS